MGLNIFHLYQIISEKAKKICVNFIYWVVAFETYSQIPNNICFKKTKTIPSSHTLLLSCQS
jgi:hypothetical protein